MKNVRRLAIGSIGTGISLFLTWWAWGMTAMEESKVSRAIDDLRKIEAGKLSAELPTVSDPWGSSYQWTHFSINGKNVDRALSLGPNRTFDHGSWRDDVYVFDHPADWAQRVYSMETVRIVFWIQTGFVLALLLRWLLRVRGQIRGLE